MLGAVRDAASARRARISCRFCGRPVELGRMRAHLREMHRLGAADLESSFLLARRDARRNLRWGRR